MRLQSHNLASLCQWLAMVQGGPKFVWQLIANCDSRAYHSPHFWEHLQAIVEQLLRDNMWKILLSLQKANAILLHSSLQVILGTSLAHFKWELTPFLVKKSRHAWCLDACSDAPEGMPWNQSLHIVCSSSLTPQLCRYILYNYISSTQVLVAGMLYLGVNRSSLQREIWKYDQAMWEMIVWRHGLRWHCNERACISNHAGRNCSCKDMCCSRDQELRHNRCQTFVCSEWPPSSLEDTRESSKTINFAIE